MGSNCDSFFSDADRDDASHRLANLLARNTDRQRTKAKFWQALATGTGGKSHLKPFLMDVSRQAFRDKFLGVWVVEGTGIEPVTC